ncbi:MAG: type II CRISPR RNA-guided endonuclease Cas9 [Clostridia bacterium]|nr:type II CRISPR RNA-guided endonuclease Cas9 [Clostridia bacterium]
MKNENYYVGLDIGTDSVGYAVTDDNYNLCKFKGNPMWGVTLFDEAQTAAGRRAFRSARRRLDRKQQRIRLLMDLVAKEIGKVDPCFFTRIKESYHYPETDNDKVRLFDTYDKQKEYAGKYPTIHHLIVELMNNTEYHDVRLVYLACAWLVAHRGHFLSEVDKHNINAVTDFENVYGELVKYIERDGEYNLPWKKNADLNAVAAALKNKQGVNKKSKAVTEALFAEAKAPKTVSEEYEYNYELVIKLLCGGKVGLKDLFDKEEYAELGEKSVVLNMDDEKLASIMQSIGDDSALISALKKVYDWSVLVDMLKGKQTISEAKVAVYVQHQKDLATLKSFTKKYIPEKYNDLFRSDNIKNNYVAYIGKNKKANDNVKVKKAANREDFCKYILSAFKSVKPDDADADEYNRMISQLEAADFMPKQVDGDNRVIPYQLYWFELNKILENVKSYLPFLSEVDESGITVAEKILSVFEFKVPYYVGPLKEKSNSKHNHWMVRKAEGKIYPWNFENVVDLDKSENAFIASLTNSCTYLPGEDVLPKCSLVYSAFEVLNEINNIRINGNDISVEIKQNIYSNVFMSPKKITPKRIRDHLISNNFISENDTISGLDVTVKSSLKSFVQFHNLIRNGLLSYSDAEKIINRATYSEDKSRFYHWLQKEYRHLPESELKYVSNLKFKEFGKLSRKLLCGIEGVNKETGEVYPSILRAMWETNCNLMQILSNRFTFIDRIDELVKEYYDLNPKSISDRLDEMYVSNAVKRPIIRTLDILKDVVKVQGHAPKRIFIEMARGSNEDLKGKRTKTRLAQIYELYEKIKDEDVRHLKKQLEEWGDAAHNRLQSDKLFLYFIQLGKCLYTGKSISIESVISGDGTYNIEHIYPRSFVKDDSIINNKILVDSKANGDKSDSFPLSSDIQNKMRGYWEKLNKLNLISDEKFKRLTRTTHFTDEEKFEFINRQLVETRQSTKAVATLLKEMYPKTEVVYVKAGLTSDFRQQFGLLKSRAVNDLHHAKDAYLNIVTGNVWHSKYSKQFWCADEQNNAKVEVVFTQPVICGGKTVWNGACDKDRVVKTARKNTAHMTMYSFYKHSGQSGGLFDQNPVSAAKDLIPLKKGKPTEIYGGYNGATIAGFILAKYKEGKKTQVSLIPLKLLYMAKFIADDDYAVQYIADELKGKASEIEILLNKRIIKIYSMISLDGARYCIRGKAGLSDVGLINMMPFMTSPENEMYIKKLERFTEKCKKNDNYVWDEKYDGVNAEDNKALYNLYIQKLSLWPYNTRPGNETFVSKLRLHDDDFEKLDVFRQAYILLQIQGVLGRMKQADLKDLKESASSGIIKLSLNLSNWKKNYTDVRIIDQSASGFFEKTSDNLLELL